jgi:drug/metabolite transporter, DME family
MTERNKGMLAIVLAALAWSTAGLFIKLLPQGAFTILCVWALYTMGVFFVIFPRESLRMNGRTLLNSLFYAGMLIAFVSATKLTTAANAIFLQYTGVAYVLLLEPLLFRLPYRPINIITMVLCFLGMSLFFLDGLDTQGGWGLWVAALSGVAYAGFLLGQRANDTRYHVAAVFWGNLIVVLVGLPSLMASPAATGSEHLMMAYLGVVQMGVGYLLFTYGLQRTTATEASLITMLEPLFNPIWVAIGFGERPAPLAIVGGLIIVAALVVRTVVMRKRSVKGVKVG